MIALYLFYNYGIGKLNLLSFSKEFVHCNVITFDGSVWMQTTWAPEGIHLRHLQVTSIDRLFRAIRLIPSLTACVVVEINTPCQFKFSPFGVQSCNELCRYMTSVDIGFTWNPKHLYKKLLKYGKIKNYSVLMDWRRQDAHGAKREGHD